MPKGEFSGTIEPGDSYEKKSFYRSADAGKVAGAGPGQAIAKKAAEKHGGNAWAESMPGKGATFYISISKDLN